MYVVYKLIKPIYLYIQSYKFKQHMNQRERKTYYYFKIIEEEHYKNIKF